MDVGAVRDADFPVSYDPPTLEETRKAVEQLKSGKAPGGCGINADMLKAEEGNPRSNNYGGLPSSLCQARSWHEFFLTVSAKSC